MSDLTAYRKSLDMSVTAFDARLKSQEDRIKELQKLTEAVPREVNDTFNIINENLQVVENHFKDTIESINQTLNKVPDLVDYSYRDIDQGLSRLARSMEELRAVMIEMESYYRRR